ncbi:MAG: hypothetical protein EA387_06450 [Nitriliruptor sp.]|nr:MAG: hypothetical protein EA387_06450 [Nitriliruptor sp.]
MGLQHDTQGTTEPSQTPAAAPGAASGPDDAELERAISGVQGVAAAVVSRDAGSGRARLRLRLQAGEDRERVAWAVAAVLRERFDIALDPASITPVTAVGAATSAPPVPPAPPRAALSTPPGRAATSVQQASDAAVAAAGSGRERVTIAHVDLRRDGRQLRATVGLAGPPGRAEGVVRTVLTSRGRLRAVAEATAQALGQLLSGPADVGIDEVRVDHRADPPRAVVALTLLAGRGEEPLLGVAVVRDDPERAVVRATLDALNRRVEPLLVHPTAAGSHR